MMFIIGIGIVILGIVGIVALILIGNNAPQKDPNFDDLIDKVGDKVADTEDGLKSYDHR